MSYPEIVTEPTEEDLHAFLAAWPPGVAKLDTEHESQVYGLLMRSGTDRVWCTRAVWTDEVDPPERADAAARAVLRALQNHDGEAMAAAAFVREHKGAVQAGVAVFAFAEGGSLPGASRHEEAVALLTAVSDDIGVALEDVAMESYEAIGQFHLEAFHTSRGLMFVAIGLRPEDDPVWADLNLTTALHFPSVGFVDDSPESDEQPEA